MKLFLSDFQEEAGYKDYRQWLSNIQLKETFIWLDAENSEPLGVIVKKSRGWYGFDKVMKRNSASRLDTTSTVQKQ